ncbi:MAG: hypothetical protein J6M18_00880, partial [Actinomycetaceae bacterium]|nr:hypothetical protein [Actinomycetaceae bacterium]
FNDGAEGVTNAVYFIIVVALPILLLLLSSVVRIVGVMRTDEVTLRYDYKIWQSLHIPVEMIVLTHYFIPRLPLYIISFTPLIVTFIYDGYTFSEHILAFVILCIGMCVEAGRICVETWRLRFIDIKRKKVGFLLFSYVVVGVILGIVFRFVLSFLYSYSSPIMIKESVVWIVRHDVGLVVVLILIFFVCMVGIYFLSHGRVSGVYKAQTKRVVTRRWDFIFPMSSRDEVVNVLTSKQMKIIVVGASTFFVLRLPFTNDVNHYAQILLLFSIMTFFQIYIFPTSIHISLMRIRHWYELSGDWKDIAWQHCIVFLMKSVPYAFISFFMYVYVVSGSVVLFGMAFLVILFASLLSDVAIARGEVLSVSETKIMVASLIQTVICVVGWEIVNIQLALGGVYILILISVYVWMLKNRLSVRKPMVRWD